MKTIRVTYTIEVSSEVSDTAIDENIYQAIELGIGLGDIEDLQIEDDEE
tara:strand:+ start:1433 stop:1579 length:147 start_codon:yes stop_codon:yes gene_type:complete